MTRVRPRKVKWLSTVTYPECGRTGVAKQESEKKASWRRIVAIQTTVIWTEETGKMTAKKNNGEICPWRQAQKEMGPKLKIARGTKEIFWFCLSILVFKGVRHGHVYWPKKKSKALNGEYIMHKAWSYMRHKMKDQDSMGNFFFSLRQYSEKQWTEKAGNANNYGQKRENRVCEQECSRPQLL